MPGILPICDIGGCACSELGECEMLLDIDFKKYYRKNELSQYAIEYIEEGRTAPSRLVGTNARGNVCTSFSSKKMGCTLQTESEGAEYAFAIEFEYSDSVLAFLDQPPLVMVDKTNKNGDVRSGSYTPDFILFENEEISVIEVKTEEQLQKLIKEKPKDWLFIGGEYIFRPAKEKFKEIGLNFKVRSTSELSAIRTANLKLIISAREAVNLVTVDFKKKINKAFRDNAWLRLSVLCDLVGVIDTTPYIQMIANNELYFSISDELLSSLESIWISQIQEMVDIGRDSRKITNNNELIPNDVEVELSCVPCRDNAKRALARLERVKNNENCSTVRRYKKKISEGKKLGLSPFQSLLDNSHKKGNYYDKIPPVVKRFLLDFIKVKYSTKIRLIKQSAYSIYETRAIRAHPRHDPVSRKTFFEYVNKSDQVEIASGRGGRRSANAEKSPTDVTKRTIVGTVPFERATLDHYLADIFIILAIANGKIYSFRPWISALIDINTKMTLATWISFRAPSTRSCAMIIRQCVRMYGMLPNEIVVDRGSDFMSVFFFSLLAHYGVNIVLRPSEDPRFGSEIERSFGSMKTQWLSKLPGNIVQYFESRSVSRTHSAEKSARLTIHDFIDQISQYSEWKNNSIIGSAFTAPVIAFEEGRKKFPFIGKKINFDDEFVIATAVDVRDYKMDPVRGIHVGEHHFWHPKLKELASRRRPVETRLEPADPYKIYCKVNNSWVTCLATGEQEFLSKDSLIRNAEAIRINDGRKFRDKIKSESDQILIQNIVDKDFHSIKNMKLYLPKEKEKELIKDKQKVVSIFSDVSSSDLEPLTSKKWGEIE